MVFPGIGTVLNVVAVLIGCGLGLLIRGRFPEKVSRQTTDGIALVVLVIGGISAADVLSPDLAAEVGSKAPLLIVLIAVLLGTVAGTLLKLEDRLESFGAWLRSKTSSSSVESIDDDAGAKGVQGFLTASVLFCTGPMTIIGSLQDGMGQGFELLAVKSALDGFTSIALTAACGAFVLGSVGVVIVVQGAFTLLGVLVGDVLTAGQVSVISATGGVIMLGMALRLMDLRPTPKLAVADMIPALAVAPALVALVAVFA